MSMGRMYAEKFIRNLASRSSKLIKVYFMSMIWENDSTSFLKALDQSEFLGAKK